MSSDSFECSICSQGQTKKVCISCEQKCVDFLNQALQPLQHAKNNVDDITEGIDKVAVDNVTTCASCGKEGKDSDMNTCNKCKMVKYCNAACKKKHRSRHKKACQKRVAELHEEQLFKEVDPDECPICMLPFLLDESQSAFKSCCGKVICHGCMYAMKVSEGKDLCAFCRKPPPCSIEENVKRLKMLMEKDNADAFHMLAGCYNDGLMATSQEPDYQKANELWLKAGELGSSEAYNSLGVSYDQGDGVEIDKMKAKHYWELAAINGHINARYNLAILEGQASAGHENSLDAVKNYHRALRHFVIAGRAGHEGSLDMVKAGFENGLITKDEYANTLRANQMRQDEMKSDERNKAAVFMY